MQIVLWNKIEESSDPITAIDRMGDWIGRSGMLPLSKVEAGKVIALVCVTEGISPIEFMRTYDVMSDGRIRKKSLAALASLRKKGGKHKWIKSGDDGKEAVIELTYEGQTITSRYTIDDAKKANLVKDGGNWVKTPANMLRARAVSNGVGMIAPEIFAGEDDGAEDGPNVVLNMKSANPEPVAETVKDKPAPKKPEPRKEHVIDIQAEPVQEAKPVEIVQQPPVKQEPSPVPVQTEQPAQSTSSGPKLSNEMVAKIEEAITPEHSEKALKWMFRNGWLKTGMSLYDLPEARAQRILKQRDSFISTINKAEK